jgi:hypothetical protein
MLRFKFVNTDATANNDTFYFSGDLPLPSGMQLTDLDLTALSLRILAEAVNGADICRRLVCRGKLERVEVRRDFCSAVFEGDDGVTAEDRSIASLSGEAASRFPAPLARPPTSCERPRLRAPRDVLVDAHSPDNRDT